MTRHYSDLGSASDWLKRGGISFQPIRSTTWIWVVTRHQYGISALVTQTSFCEGSSGDLARRRLFSQAKRAPTRSAISAISAKTARITIFEKNWKSRRVDKKCQRWPRQGLRFLRKLRKLQLLRKIGKIVESM